MRRHIWLILLFLTLGMSHANAACGDGWRYIGDCFVSKPPVGEGMPQNDSLLAITHSSTTKLNTSDLYAVTVTCSVKNVLPAGDWNPFVQTNLVTTHLAALTTSKLSQADLPTPDKSRATITVFSVTGDDKTRKVFLNKNCRSVFLVSGRESLFIAATANQATTNTPGVLTRLIYEAIQVAIPILPLIQGTALIGTMAGDIAKTQDPLNKVVSELDKGRTYTKGDDLYIGDNVIRTPYSRTVVNVSKIKSLLDPSNGDFLKIFEDATDASEPSLALGSAAANLTQKCKEFAAGLKGRNFSPPDIAYALVLISQAASLDPDKTLDCMTSRYALQALDKRDDPAWNRYNGRNYKVADVNSYFTDDPNGTVLIQPKLDKGVLEKLRILTTVLGGYLQTGGKQTVDWSSYFADPLHQLNTTKYYSSSLGGANPALAEVLSNLVKGNFVRAGCLTSDTDALAAIILFRSTDLAQKQFKPADTVAMRIWNDDKQRIYRLQFDYDIDVLEKALNGKKQRICGEGLEVAGAASDTQQNQDHPAKP